MIILTKTEEYYFHEFGLDFYKRINATRKMSAVAAAAFPTLLEEMRASEAFI